jgi:OmcA/MtrC family decaheme c-type cytochrome
VSGAHVIAEESSQLRGVTFNLLGVSNTAPGQRPVIAFNVKDKNGAIIDPNSMSRLAFTVAGPTYEYQQYFNESALGQVTQAGADRFEFVFPRALPNDASFVWTAQIEGYLNTQVMGPAGSVVATVRDAGFDQSVDFTVTSDVAWPRKSIVSQENCNACHEKLYFHGGNRQNVENCVLCHNPNVTDEAVRPIDAFPPTTIDLKVILHKIHSGEQLTPESYIIYGRGGTPHEFGDVLYPSPRSNCSNCHRPQSNYPEFLHYGAQPVIARAQGEVVSTTAPTTAACSGCHDTPEAVSHMRANTAPDGSESCVLCHADGKQAPVREVHQAAYPVVEFPR